MHGMVVGSNNGSPNLDGYIVEVDYLPWLNTKLRLRNTSTTRSSTAARANYDGSGRNASNNNTFYALLWIAF